jgi:hypothetical protein
VALVSSSAQASPNQGITPNTAKTDYTARNSAKTNLSSTAGTETAVLGVTVPAGNWVITANGDIVDTSGKQSNIVRCDLFDTAVSGNIASSAVDVGLSSGDGSGLLGTVAVGGSVVTSSTTTIDLECALDAIGPSDATIYFDGGGGANDGFLWAHKADSLHSFVEP